MDFQYIAVACDFSESARQAFRTALRMAGETNACLTAIHIVPADKARVFTGELDGSGFALLGAFEEQLKKWIEDDLRGTRVEPEILVRVGSPARDLPVISEEIGADLLVVGNAGMSHPNRSLGTVAATFARRASAPAFLIARDEVQPEEVVACIDHSESSDLVMQQAIRLAACENRTLVVLHIADSPQSWTDSLPTMGAEQFGVMSAPALSKEHLERVREGRRCELEVFTSRYADSLEGIEIERHVEESLSPAEGILRFAESSNNPLLVIGAHGRSGLLDFILGTTAERIIADAEGSVLVVRDAQSS